MVEAVLPMVEVQMRAFHLHALLRGSHRRRIWCLVGAIAAIVAIVAVVVDVVAIRVVAVAVGEIVDVGVGVGVVVSEDGGDRATTRSGSF